MIHLYLKNSFFRDLLGTRPLIIFHWDADGIASSAILTKYLDLKPILYTPRIGFYRIDFDEVSSLSGYDNIFIVDFGVDTKEIEKLKDFLNVDVYVFDHHVREGSDSIHILDYKDDVGGIYPSESVMLTDKLGLKPDILTAIGYVGDLFDKALNNRYSYILDVIWRDRRLTYYDLKLMVDYIQSNYVFMDRDEIKSAVFKLIEVYEDPERIFKNAKWRSRYLEMNRSIKETLDMKPEKIGRVNLFEIESNIYITSYVGRALATKYKGEYIIVGVPELQGGYAQIYIRIDGKPHIDFSSLIVELNSMGLYAGGKKEVIGVFLDKNRYEEILKFVIGRLNGE